MKEKAYKRSAEDSDIDITPMLDVVFIMLIFFVVTASFVKEEAIELYVPPQTSTESPPITRPIVLNIDANDNLSIDGRALDIRAVEAMIVRLKAERPDAMVSVLVDGQASTKTLISAIDGIRSADVMTPSVSIKES